MLKYINTNASTVAVQTLVHANHKQPSFKNNNIEILKDAQYINSILVNVIDHYWIFLKFYSFLLLINKYAQII